MTSAWRVERLEQGVEALEQDRDDGLLVEDRHHEGISRRHGFRSLLRAKVQTLSGKGLNKGFAARGASSRYSVSALSDRMVKMR